MSVLLGRLARTTAVAVIGIAALAWGSDGFTAFTAEAARRQRVLTSPQPLPDMVLEDQDGRRFSFADYAGRKLAVEFIYTRCDTICYSLGSAFRQLRDALPASALGRDVALLSISFDPQRDGPAELRDYARRFGADGTAWKIARPADGADLPALLATFGIVAIPDGLGGFAHNAALHLVGRDRRLQRIVDLDEAPAFASMLAQRS